MNAPHAHLDARPMIVDACVELLHYVLDKPVGGSGVASVDVIVVDLTTDAGLVGTGFSYVLSSPGHAAARAAQSFADALVGKNLLHPEVLHRRARASLNRTGKGVAYVGLAAVDLACWDLYATSLNVPLGVAMGGEPRAVPIYGSGGFYAGQDPEDAATQARHAVARGLRAVKPRVSGVPHDLRVIRAVRDAVAEETFVAVDANEKCSGSNARWFAHAARDFDLLFVEEPLPARDVEGYADLARTGGPAIATGEHLQGLDEAMPFLSRGLCRVMQPDLAMMGGLSESLRVARVAEAFGIEIAPHFLPNLFVHLAAACPNVTWLEEFPLLEGLFQRLERPDARGLLSAPDITGHGLVWADGVRVGLKVPID